MNEALYRVDAFTDRPFAGNPAAVCLLSEPRPEAWMQALANEMNLSETAFLMPKGGQAYDLRWFTPLAEVDLCGHATLAAAHVLWEEQLADRGSPLCFDTRSDTLVALWKGGEIELSFPADPPLAAEPPAGLEEALGARLKSFVTGRDDYLVELESEQAVLDLRPDLRALAAFPTRGIIVTARGNSGDFDFVSRFFAPRFGIDEDPVTGSAHCLLGPYWELRLHKSRFRAWQASRRGGKLRVENLGRVLLAGQAVTVARGRLAI